MDPTYQGLPAPVPQARPVRQGQNLKPILLVAVLFLVLVAVFGFIFMRGSTDKYLPQQFAYRMERLQDLARDGQEVTNNDVRKIASETTIILSGHMSTLKPLIPTVKSDKTLGAIKAEEQDKAGQETLKNARLNGIYDTTYKRLFEQKLQESYALATEVHDKTTSKKLKDALANLRTDLGTYYRQLQAIQL